MSKRLLIIEDDAGLNQMLQLHFEDEGFEVSSAFSCSDGLELWQESSVDLILLDQQLPDGNGLDLLQTIHAEDPLQSLIMMTGQHDLELAIQAIKSGATDFIHKPIKIDELQIVVERVLANQRLSREVEALQPETSPELEKRELIGRSDAMLQVSKEIALCAGSNTTVLITGESGTGKEVVARLVHNHSGLSGPFVAVNCAAIVDTLLESELFGHEKGAFTGATGRKPGKFELAQDGTLFLDEIGELALPLQRLAVDARQRQVEARLARAGLPVHLVRGDAHVPRRVLGVHPRPGLVGGLPVVGLEAIGGGPQIGPQRRHVGTEAGILYRLRKENPDKTFILPTTRLDKKAAHRRLGSVLDDYRARFGL